MANNKHTPGPWVVHKRDDEDRGTLVMHVGEMDDYLVCATNVSWRYPMTNADNAEFIVKACNSHYDLLEALRQMVANAEADGKTYRSCYTQAVAAIAKAEGR